MAVKRLISAFSNLVTSVRDVVWPRLCPVCGIALLPGEEILCLECLTNLPRTHLHLAGYNPKNNPVIDRLVNPAIPINRGTAWFYYGAGSPFSRIILEAKFHSQPYILRHAGRLYAKEILPDGFFSDIDVIIPVPVWISRELSRGYNQTEFICRGLSEVTGIPIGLDLIARRPHRSQRKRSATQRHLGLDGVFKMIRPNEYRGKHILIVDDVLTTGSTMRSALQAIHTAVPDATLSVLTLGCTPP